MWQLRQAFSRQEKIEMLLENLEELRKEGSVDELTYNRLREEYQGYQEANRTEIEKIKSQLVTHLTQAEQNLQELQRVLKALEARFKVGQLTDRDYQNQKQRVLAQIGRTENRISELKNQISAQSAAEVGGPVEVKIEPARGVTLPGISLHQLPEIKLAGLENIITPLRIAGFIVSLLMLIFVFLPWVSVEALGIEFDYTALQNISAEETRKFNSGGIFVILAGILGIAVSLIAARSSSRGWGYLGAGALGLGGIVIFSVVFAKSYQNTLEQLGEYNGGSFSFSPQVGGILYLLATLTILVIGYLEIRQGER